MDDMFFDFRKILFNFSFFYGKFYKQYFFFLVDFFIFGYSDDLILIDRIVLVVGVVLDGFIIDVDEGFQVKMEEICVCWKNFYDLELGISQ